MLAMLALFGVFLLLSTGLAAKKTAVDKALGGVTVDPEQQYECLMFRLEDKLYRMAEEMNKQKVKLAKMAKMTVMGRKMAKPVNTTHATEYAFSAYLSTSTGNTNLGSSGTLKFAKTISNIGRAYNPHTGVFTAAVDGVYVFHFHAKTYPSSRHCSLGLYQNNNMIAVAHGYNHYAEYGNTAIIELKKSNAVHVIITSTVSTSTCYVYGRFTTFSGFKLP